jgi:hypothetical protein
MLNMLHKGDFIIEPLAIKEKKVVIVSPLEHANPPEDMGCGHRTRTRIFHSSQVF